MDSLWSIAFYAVTLEIQMVRDEIFDRLLAMAVQISVTKPVPVAVSRASFVSSPVSDFVLTKYLSDKIFS